MNRFIFGPPLRTSGEGQERLDRPRALGAVGLDALASVAYPPPPTATPHHVHREAGGTVTVFLPEVVPRHLWPEGLHNQTALELQPALRVTPDVAVTTLPVRLER